MILQRKAALAAIVLSVIFAIGCGETFRPITTPIIGPGADPQALKHATVLFTAGTGTPGAVIHVNISGDTNVGQVSVGHDPVNIAFFSSAQRLFVSNRGDSTISTYLTFQPTLGVPTTTSLPPGSAPTFAFSAVTTAVYAALSGTNQLGFIDPNLNALTKTISVGSNPIAISGTTDGKKVYVVNQGSNDVSVVNATDFVVSSTIPVGTSPSWIVSNADSTRMYVVNRGSNDVTVIDTATDTVVTTVPVGSAPTFGIFDPRLLRVYIANSADNRISIINADPSAGAAFHTSTFVTVGSNPVSIAPLADGSRVYVANAGSDSVSAINTLNNTVTATISTDVGAIHLQPVSIGAAPDSSKVIVAVLDRDPVGTGAPDDSGIEDIVTATNTVIANIPAPVTPCPSGIVTTCRMHPVQVAITP
jgi:YVTN family beta-propeller protein